MRYKPGAVVVWHKRYGRISEKRFCLVLHSSQHGYRLLDLDEDRGPSKKFVLSHNILREATSDEETAFKRMIKRMDNERKHN